MFQTHRGGLLPGRTNDSFSQLSVRFGIVETLVTPGP